MAAPSGKDKSSRRPDLRAALKRAANRALGGGLAGASAMVCQVTGLMWMRTIMNYQYRNGTTTLEAAKTLYRDGGLRRFYRGYGPAMIQGPLSRFGDTAANAGMLAAFDYNDTLKKQPTAVKTMCASVVSASMRIFLLPVDTVKTMMQVEGKNGIPALRAKVRANGPSVFFYGAAATFGANWAGHFPFFFTFNVLQENWPKYPKEEKLQNLKRNALIGFASSVCSDTVSNSIRVLKTYKQSATTKVTYMTAVRSIVAQDGWLGFLGRGLKTRLLANGVQGMLFSVLWRHFETEINALFNF